MESLLFWLAATTLLLVAAITIEFAVGNRSLRRLKDLPLFSRGNAPKVSVIVAARNEARNIEQGLSSLLAQEYPNLELIAVDDRSTDETGAILDRMAAKDPRLHVEHVTGLPSGWLGKTHALQCGADRASGAFLLFTDADVVIEPSVVGRAVGHIHQANLDHVAVAPRPQMPGTFLNMFGGAFALFFGMYARPWKASAPKSRWHIGIGAFNLVRADVYRAAGGHRAIAMRPDDDMKLGKLIKKTGFHQEMLLGDGSITVEWYSSVGELVRGLEKNSFAGLEYSLAAIVATCLGQLAVFDWPVAALVLTRGATWWLNVAIVGSLMLLYIDNAGCHGLKRWYCVGLPLAALLFVYIIGRATLKTLVHGGIDWRGTHYSLRELKANKV
ncbi:MAG TPA: glycosyltransferase family 2 protein [Verrucomicrobiae bacterium]|nr:glycosyltransferase family 2 protein [Verrucomicrobiae bacterium]